jgi:pyridoxine/pyridoxamine 5'-phosphate oxidase
MHENHAAILEQIWGFLARGVNQASDPFHTPVLGTVSIGGCNLRTVVLREVDATQRLLLCHTDVRSPKFHEIQTTPGVSWLFYHPKEKVQLRIYGLATLHTDDEIADRQWRVSKLSSRRCYCAVTGPGTTQQESDSGLPEKFVERLPTEQESEELGRQHFAVIACQIMGIDWLYLQARGHQRTQFSWQGDHFHGIWVTP